MEVFSALQAGDVLFIDSTHVLKTGSDVAWLYGDLLPALNEGVYVHIHDMFYPFEYPREWVLEGRAWSEVYVVRAFLAFNTDFEIVLFNDWLGTFHRDRIAAELPLMLANSGGALWLKRTAKSRLNAPRLRVAVDATPLLGVRTGVGRYVEHLLAELAQSRDDLRCAPRRSACAAGPRCGHCRLECASCTGRHRPVCSSERGGAPMCLGPRCSLDGSAWYMARISSCPRRGEPPAS